jgi:hypothetical protein
MPSVRLAALICLERKTMTRLYIDKREIAPLPPDMTSLDQVLKLVEANHLAPQTIIRQVHVDGLPLLPEDRAACLPERIDNREMIEIFTGTLSEVAIDSIREAVTYLERVESATHSLATSFRLTPGPEAFENLKQFYEGFYWLNLLLDRLDNSFEITLESLQVGGTNAREQHHNLIAALKAIIEAHEKRDFGLVADLLEFEVLPLVPICRSMFSAIRERIVTKH